jgi:hypothetical protein
MQIFSLSGVNVWQLLYLQYFFGYHVCLIEREGEGREREKGRGDEL